MNSYALRDMRYAICDICPDTKDFIVEELKKQIAGFKAEIKEQTVGTGTQVGDGIARISGSLRCR